MHHVCHVPLTRRRLPLLQMLVLATVLLAALGRPAPAAGQAPLLLVNENTTTSDISFKFVSTKTFDGDELKNQIALESPGFWDRLKGVLPLVSAGLYPFSPIKLQRDVVRLRHFYERNGFLHPRIDYPASQLDTTENEIQIIFTIEEGPPLIIQDVSFYGPDSTTYAVRQFEGPARRRWIEIRDRNPFRIGERYTEFNRIRIEDAVLRGLKNSGFAFANVGSEVIIDSTANTTDLRFYVDAGPRGRFSEIEIAGNESVSREVVLRELPFKIGDRFSSDKLAEGQRELFGLQLFRVALAAVPEQPRDSTVTVRFNVREASPRYLTAEGGYARNLGLTAEGSWTHRNFLGNARVFSANLLANTGVLADPGANTIAPLLFRASLSLRQPYLFTTRLSGVISPFVQIERNPLLEENDAFLRVNAREVGFDATAIYEILPFRTASFQYSFSRSLQFTQPDTSGAGDPDEIERLRDIFSKSILSTSATFGQADDYISPSRGYLLRPFVELGGAVLGSGVEYFKVGGEATGYLPLTERISLAGRLTGGHLGAFSQSRQALGGELDRISFLRFENRFDPIYFYNGGSSDLRGWRERWAGEKDPRQIVYNRGTSSADTIYTYEAVGGRSKAGFNLEIRMPFPGLGPKWGTAAFLDAGQTWNATVASTQAEERFSLDNFRYGIGAGARYRTPIGQVRLDLAYKLNPSYEDLRDAEDVYRFRNDLTNEPPGLHPWRRLRLHLSIGQSF